MVTNGPFSLDGVVFSPYGGLSLDKVFLVAFVPLLDGVVLMACLLPLDGVVLLAGLFVLRWGIFANN